MSLMPLNSARRNGEAHRACGRCVFHNKKGELVLTFLQCVPGSTSGALRGSLLLSSPKASGVPQTKARPFHLGWSIAGPV